MHKDPPPPKVIRTLQLYLRGAIARIQFLNSAIEEINEGCIQEFVDQCPADLMADLLAFIRQFPPVDDENAWLEIREYGATTCAPWLTASEIEELQRQGQLKTRAQLRNGIGLLRQLGSRNEN